GIQPAVLNRPSDSSAKGRKVNQALRTRSNVNRKIGRIKLVARTCRWTSRRCFFSPAFYLFSFFLGAR
ncbi:MAG: hypothetical protein ACFFCS_26540, partial [Candidatus Hodarchaeota archaeon]